jgi:hypothetical protein
MRAGRAERNQRGAGGSGQAAPPDGCGELGQAEAVGAACVGGGSGRCDACALGCGARTVPVVAASAGFATTFGFGLGFGFASAGSAVASFRAAVASFGAAVASFGAGSAGG